jgi:hypothetical protein
MTFHSVPFPAASSHDGREQGGTKAWDFKAALVLYISERVH